MTDARPSPLAGPVLALIALLFLIGGLSRLFPLLDWPDRIFWQFLSEDGYLMQTVARNFALGLGLSTAEGSLPTNGVQPLATFVFAAAHALVGGDKMLGIAAVTLISTLQALLAAWAMAQLIRQLAGDRPQAAQVGGLGAGLWLCAYGITAHSSNGLETGLYHLMVLLALLLYMKQVREQGDRPATLGESAVLGLMLGGVFLARNDAVFFIGALLSAHVLIGGAAGGGLPSRLRDAVVAGASSLVVAAPWLIHNKIRFGSIVPISGAAQSHGSDLGQNLALVPANLFEATMVLLPVPGSLETRVPVMALCLLLVLAVLLGFGRWIRGRGLLPGRLLLTTVLFLGGIAGYYGIFFGAPWFVPRYFSVLSVLLWPMSVLLAAALGGALVQRRPALLRPLGGLGLILLLGLALNNARMHWVRGETHMHRQVAEWVQQHVPAGTWVGAVQTGTLGYFHDRTLNLDGKVNPEAMRVLREVGDVRDAYVLGSPIQYLVDWSAIADWVERPGAPGFSAAFQVRVRDEAANLGVVERLPATPAAPASAHAPSLSVSP